MGDSMPSTSTSKVGEGGPSTSKGSVSSVPLRGRSSSATTTSSSGSNGLHPSPSTTSLIERQVMQVYVGSFSNLYEALSIEASKQTTAEEIVDCIAEKLGLKDATLYELAEVVGNEGGQECKERRIGLAEYPLALQLLWPKTGAGNRAITGAEYRFCLRRKLVQSTNWSFSWTDSNDSQLLKDYFLRFLYQPRDREYPDLCQLPDLTEQTLLENLKARFDKGHIYTYVGSILIAVNPFKFYPIYNPKYVQLYQNRRLGDLPPHIFAIADASYQAMLKKRCNQCIVISGESGSGKTESTNLLLHHLTALSQKGSHGSGVEQTILGAGPVLEAFGNAKTKFNNNSSRFGKFIQVNYKENGMVHGAIVQKYLLEKSRIVSHAKGERNYHVFYYLLAGASPEEKESLHLTKPADYYYLNQSKCYTLDGVDEAYELGRLKQSLEMVGFSAAKQKELMSLLASVLHLGNVDFSKKSTYHNDETVMVKNPEVVTIISKLLQVKEENLLSALTCKRTKAAKGEMIIIHYKMADAVATRDAMAKCLYAALFDWIVMQVNSALLSKQDIREHKGNYIGVLDIFGFEDFGDQNYFEQFCINFANEHLHHYFNQHVFKYEQEEYKREGITWQNIDFHDNVGCLNLIQGRPHGLLCLLDDQCNFPGASDASVLQKFVNHHNDSPLFEVPPCRQSAFVIKHYAGKVKYQIRDFREKNMDLMRPDIVCLLKGSENYFVRELVGYDPLALFRWQILKAFFKAYRIFSRMREDSQRKRAAFTGSLPPRNNIQNLTRKLGIECITSTRKNKIARISSFKNGQGIEKTVKNLKVLKIIVGRTSSIQGPTRTGKKTTQTVTFAFQQSLSQLMETLNQANPFFVRCIKSNSDKIPGHFDDMLVLVQLRYTGMLDTVKIRQSGYSVRLSFDEFIQHYRILLPKGLLSSQNDVRRFLQEMNLNPEYYQMGKSKIFMRESEKLALDNQLHREILQRIVTLQRWVKTWVTRRRFVQMKEAAICLQAHCRRWIAQRRLANLKQLVTCERAAVTIQRTWKCFKERTKFLKLKKATINFQAHGRGYLLRKKLDQLREMKTKKSKDRESLSTIDGDSITGETFLSVLKDCPAELVEELIDLVPSTSNPDDEDVFAQLPPSPPPPTNMSEIIIPHRTIRKAAHSLNEDPITTPPMMSPRKMSLQTANLVRTELKPSLSLDPDIPERPKIRPLPRRLSLTRAQMPSHHPSGSFTPDDCPIPPDKLPSRSMSEPSGPLTPTDHLHHKPGHKGFKNRLKKIISGSGGTGSHGGHGGKGHDNTHPLKDIEYSSLQSQSDSSLVLSSTQFHSPDMFISDPVISPHFKPHDPVPYIGSKGDVCSMCNLPSVGPGHYQCPHCTYIFHKKCLSSRIMCPRMGSPQKGIHKHQPSRPPRTKERTKSQGSFQSPRSSQSSSIEYRPSAGGTSGSGSGSVTSWSVTRTTEFTDRKDVLIGDVSELHYLETFLNKKINSMGDSKFSGKESMVDHIFKSSLKEFKTNLISTYSVASQEPKNMHISYKNLIDNFEQVMIHVCQRENTYKSFPVIMGVNAFRGFLDEFRSLAQSHPDKSKKANQKRIRSRSKSQKPPKSGDVIECQGHIFRSSQANIPTVCEVCSSLMWLMEKIWVCQGCKLTCHKKCTAKLSIQCKDGNDPSDKTSENGLFGILLVRLVDQDHRVPDIVEDLFTFIEMKGLYTEGLYRKSGTTSKINELKTKLDKRERIDFDSYSIHVLTGVLKSFLREMPDPLLTFDLYDDFLWASTTSDPGERVQAIYSHIQKLPRPHYDLLERLTFHLARVAQHESDNRMTTNSLAIVLAPCILRTDKPMQMQDKLNDINKQTMCIQAIINERLKQVSETLADIDMLDNAFRTATSRLSTIRQSRLNLDKAFSSTNLNKELDEEDILQQQLLTFRSEKAHLTTMLPSFRLTSEDEMETTTELDSTTVGDSLESEYTPNDPPFRLCPVDLNEFPSAPGDSDGSNLRHLTKNRAGLPLRRRPSRINSSDI